MGNNEPEQFHLVDDNLKAVFNGKKQVSMFEMTKLVSGHLKK